MMTYDEFVDYCERYLDEVPPDVIAELEFVYLEKESELPAELRRDDDRFHSITFGFFSTYFSPTIYMCYYAFVEGVETGMFREKKLEREIEITLLHEIRHYVEYKIGKPDLAKHEADMKFIMEQKLEKKNNRKKK